MYLLLIADCYLWRRNNVPKLIWYQIQIILTISVLNKVDLEVDSLVKCLRIASTLKTHNLIIICLRFLRRMAPSYSYTIADTLRKMYLKLLRMRIKVCMTYSISWKQLKSKPCLLIATSSHLKKLFQSIGLCRLSISIDLLLMSKSKNGSRYLVNSDRFILAATKTKRRKQIKIGFYIGLRCWNMLDCVFTLCN